MVLHGFSTLKMKKYTELFPIWLPTVLVILLIGTIGVSIVGDYGITTDEPMEIDMVQWNIDLIKEGKPLPEDLSFYGPFFNTIAEIIFRITKTLSPSLRDGSFHNNSKKLLLKKIKVKHYSTFLFSILAYFTVAKLAGPLCGKNSIWLAPVILAFLPRFWGHSFFNPKDIPFATMFIVCTFVAALLLRNLSINNNSESEKRDTFLVKEIIAFAIAVGILTGIRVGGFFLIFYLLATHLFIEYPKLKFKFFREYKNFYKLLIATWQITTTICYPSIWYAPIVIFMLASSYFGKDTWFGNFLATHPSLQLKKIPQWYGILFLIAFTSWVLTVFVQTSKDFHITATKRIAERASNFLFKKPVKYIVVFPSAVIFHFSFLIWFVSALVYLSKHSWKGDVLFDGNFISAHNLPWTYIPKWLMITIPLPFQIAFVIGILFIIFNNKHQEQYQKSIFLLLLFQIFFLPLIAITRGSTLYDAIRQFLFILPGVAVLATVGIVRIYDILKKKFLKVLYVTVLLAAFSVIAYDMVQLHPYEYIYFNRISGGLLANASRYQTDYWGLSLNKTAEWLNKNCPTGSSVVVASPNECLELLLSNNIKLYKARYRKRGDWPPLENGDKFKKPFYYVAIRKWILQSAFPECPTVFKEERMGVPLSLVKNCVTNSKEK